MVCWVYSEKEVPKVVCKCNGTEVKLLYRRLIHLNYDSRLCKGVYITLNRCLIR